MKWRLISVIIKKSPKIQIRQSLNSIRIHLNKNSNSKKKKKIQK